MKLTIGNVWAKSLQKRVGSFEFDVGVLQDKPHRLPADPLQVTGYAGGPILRTSRIAGELTVGEVFVQNQERLNINLLSRPFQDETSDIIKFTKAFMQLVTKKNLSIKRIENLLQAIVRNPILKQEYGSNASATADAKGFDRHLFATGQMFKAIKAVVKRV